MADRNTVLWQISAADLEPSYIMGTMHVRDLRAFQNFEKVKHLIKQCSYYFAEMDLNQAELMQDPKDFILEDGVNLEILLGVKKYEKIRKALGKSFQFNLDDHKQLLPFLISNILAENILQADHQKPLDHILWTFAEEQDLIMGGLESFMEQQSIMRKIPLDFQLKSIKDIARNPSKFRKNLLCLVDYYVEEDIQMLYKMSKKSMGKLRKLMLWERNSRMSKRIGEFMAQGQCFFALGAAHLSGQKGVLNLVKQQGIKLKPLH
jgi:uncharacterized protein YbaP (TraB family)